MEKYSSVKSGKEPDLSDYKEYKLKEDNIGKIENQLKKLIQQGRFYN